MPLVEITVPEGTLSEAAAEVLQQQVADSVLKAMELPRTDFFTAATWVYVREAAKGLATTRAGTPPGVLVVVTPWRLPDPRAQRGPLRRGDRVGAGGDRARHRRLARRERGPGGNWAVNGGLTRRAKIDEFVAEAEAEAEAAQAGRAG